MNSKLLKIKESLDLENNSIDFEKVVNCTICREWVTMCSKSYMNDTEALIYKEYYWKEHANVLKTAGFENRYELFKALTETEVELLKDLDGSLLIVKVGNDTYPARTSDMKAMDTIMKEFLEGRNVNFKDQSH